DRQLIDRLNDLGYAQRATVEKPGEFSVAGGAVSILPRSSDFKGKVVHVRFQKPTMAAVKTAARRTPAKPADHVERLELGTQPSERLTLDAPVLTSLIG